MKKCQKKNSPKHLIEFGWFHHPKVVKLTWLIFFCSVVSSPRLAASDEALQGCSPKAIQNPNGPGVALSFQKVKWRFPPYGCCQKYGKTPQIIHFNRVWNHSKPSILGYPYFWKHPYCWWFRNPVNSPVEGQVVLLPLFTTGLIDTRWLAGFLPSTAFWGVLVVGHKTGLVEIFDDIRVLFSKKYVKNIHCFLNHILTRPWISRHLLPASVCERRPCMQDPCCTSAGCRSRYNWTDRDRPNDLYLHRNPGNFWILILGMFCTTTIIRYYISRCTIYIVINITLWLVYCIQSFLIQSI